MSHEAATARLVAATRRLMAHASTTTAGPQDLTAAADAIDRVVDGLGAPGSRVLRVPFDEAAVERVRDGEAWVTAVHNPMFVPFEVRVDGPRARADLVPGALLEGPPDYLHGGFAAHLLDVLLGTLVQAQGRPAYTGTLELRFLRPTELDVPVVVEGVMGESDGRKMRVEGWISQEGERTVEAHGLFVQPVAGSDRIR